MDPTDGHGSPGAVPPASWIQKLGCRTATCSDPRMQVTTPNLLMESLGNTFKDHLVQKDVTDYCQYLSKKHKCYELVWMLTGHPCFSAMMFWKDREVSAGLLHNVAVCIPLHAVLVPFFTQHGEFISLPCKCANENLSLPVDMSTYAFPCVVIRDALWACCESLLRTLLEIKTILNPGYWSRCFALACLFLYVCMLHFDTFVYLQFA